MKKTVLSCVAILSLCVTTPVFADVDETFMDWSYASGLDPKPRPVKQERHRNTTDFASTEATTDLELLDTDIFATSEINQFSNTQDSNSNAEYSNWSYTSSQNMAQDAHAFDASMGQSAQTHSWGNNGYNTSNNSVNMMGLQAPNAQARSNQQYYQVPIQAIQTPAEIHRIDNPVKVQYPITKQYPISMQYPVTIQKEITVQKPVVVQQPIVVQRPIVMQQPVMVQHQPLMLQNRPLMVQQQPTVVQKQPIIVNAPAPTVIPAPAMQMSGATAHAIQVPAHTPCTTKHAPQVPPMGYTTTPPATTIQIPMQVNGTLTGTFVPVGGCNGGCIK